MTDDTERLLPCPFCDGSAHPDGVVRYSNDHEAWFKDGTRATEAFFVNCIRCGVSNKGLIGHQTRDDAIAAWNTRAQPVQSVHQLDGSPARTDSGARLDAALDHVTKAAVAESAKKISAAIVEQFAKSAICPDQPRPDDDVVERVARALYACEKERSDHTDKVLSAAKGHPVNFRMEPWDDVAELFRGDARAALSAIQPAIDEMREVLASFAVAADDLDENHHEKADIWEAPAALNITAGDLRRAAALHQKLTEAK